MSSSIKQRPNPGVYTEAILLAIFISTVVLVVGTTTAAVHLAAWTSGTTSPPASPFELFFGVITGAVAWTPAATKWAIATVAGIVTVLALVGYVSRSLWWRTTRTDKAARRMGRRNRDTAALSRKNAQAVAERFGVTGTPGLELGRNAANGAPIFTDWESVSVIVAGPRTGKTSALAIPALVQAPGAALVTSNKRDVCDATRDLRERVGRVWVFDPQGLVDEPGSWWWNPLSYVTDETHAQTLAEVFASASRKPGAKTDAYFDNAAVELLSCLLLAAAVDARPLTAVYLWLTDPQNDEAAQILERHDHRLPAAAVRGMVNAPDKQRAGVFGTAQQIGSFMTNREAMAWTTPRTGPRFDPREFVKTTDTLYSLSKEGRGNSAPIVTALTLAVCEAAEDYAKTLPNGRLSVPMVAVLDEAANVVRLNTAAASLPDLASHYGSRGINLLTFLQSWSQGVEVWGRDGMRKLWSAANTKIYGGGVSEAEFLEELSRLIGDYTHVDASVSYGDRRGRSVQAQNRATRILDVADLAALDRGRMVVFASGAVPVLAKSAPWWDGPHAHSIKASIAAHDPGALR